MKTEFALDDAIWQKLLEGVAEQYDELTTIRGFQFYKQGRVEDLIVREGAFLEAYVNDRHLYNVIVSLESLEASSCTCSLTRGCAHQIAVLLRYVEHCGRPVQAMVNARITLLRGAGKIPAERRDSESDASAWSNMARTAPGTTGAKERPAPFFTQAALPAAFTEQELTELTIAQWHERFRKRKGPLQMLSMNDANDLIYNLQKMRPDLPLALEQLFNLHTLLFTLEQMILPDELKASNASYFLGYHIRIALDSLVDMSLNLLSEKLVLSSEDSPYWKRLMETADYLRERMVVENSTKGCFASLYPALWNNWLSPAAAGSKPLYEEELRKLQAAKGALGDALALRSWTIAQCLMLLYLERETEALSVLVSDTSSKGLESTHLMPLLSFIRGAERWEILRVWLVETGPLLAGYRNDGLRWYGEYWSAVVERLPDAEALMWDTITSLLPFTRYVYEDMLVTSGNWERWMDYQMTAGEDPLSFKVSVFKPIEKEAPELMLPFYHQAVERYVLQKNRDGYKLAVKLLKRLSKLYARIKQAEQWEQFFSAFTGRNSRLRALQEELRKGGLLP